MTSDWGHLARDALSGAAGAFCLTCAGLPFDVIKLRMQLAGPSQRAASPLAHVARIALQEGPAQLWRGFGPALASALIENTVVFAVFGAIKRVVAPSAGDEAALTFPEHAACGGFAGVFSATAICPAEVLKCRLQAQAAAAGLRVLSTGSGANGVIACAVAIWRAEGARGFFAGLAPLLARDVPFNTLFFGSYRFFSSLLFLPAVPDRPPLLGSGVAGDASVPHAPDQGLRPSLAGGLAGMSAWTVVFPFDTLKSRLQAQPPSAGGGARGAAAAGQLLLAILREEGGLRALYRGWSAAVLRAFPANAALFWGVTTTSTLLARGSDSSGAMR